MMRETFLPWSEPSKSENKSVSVGTGTIRRFDFQGQHDACNCIGRRSCDFGVGSCRCRCSFLFRHCAAVRRLMLVFAVGCVLYVWLL